MNWSWLSKLSPVPVVDWLGRTFSADSTSSSSRVLQAVIVLNLVPIMWFVVSRANWTISDNARLVLITLIVSGAGSYMTGKLKEG